MVKNILIAFENTIRLSADFLIVSAGFLILSADILIVLTDTIRKSVRKRVRLFALSLSCADLWPSWEGKSGNFVDVLSPRMSTNKAKEHESVLVLGPVGPVGLVRGLSQRSW